MRVVPSASLLVMLLIPLSVTRTMLCQPSVEVICRRCLIIILGNDFDAASFGVDFHCPDFKTSRLDRLDGATNLSLSWGCDAS